MSYHETPDKRDGTTGAEEECFPPSGPTQFPDAAPDAVRRASAATRPQGGEAPTRIAHQWRLLDGSLGLSADRAPAQALFPALPWASVERANTINKARSLPAVKNLTQIFSEAGFASSVNLNVGSGELSLTIPLFPTEGHGLEEARPVVVRAMLAALPEQAALEDFYAARMPSKTPAEASTGDLLANKALALFAEQTGVGIWKRAVDPATKSVKLFFAPYEDLVYGTGTRRMLLRYSRCYAACTGVTNTASYELLRRAPPAELQAAMDTERERLISDMEAFFWQKVAEFPYVATPSLRETLGAKLRHFIALGLRDPAGGFLPPADSQFSFFLYGGAGTGKSTMVAAFGQALQATLRRFIDAGKRTDIVKVPLNGLTPESIGQILRVQGISDMSIERLVEQAVQRGGVVVLHLEEIPEDPTLQEALVSSVKSMVASLLRRYHHYAGNIILAFTSNYPAADLVARATTEITVVAPSAEGRSQHCVGMLETSLKQATRANNVSVELKFALPLTQDMRPLCQWWTTLSFHIAERVKQFAAAKGFELPPSSISASLTSGNGGSVISIDLIVIPQEAPSSPASPKNVEMHNGLGWTDVDTKSNLAVRMPRPCSEPAMGVDGSEHVQWPPPPLLRESTSSSSLSVQGDEDLALKTSKPELTVSSMDGFFFVEGDGGDWGAAGTEAERFRQRKIATVVRMSLSGALKPGVVVLTGGDQDRNAVESETLEQVFISTGRAPHVVRVDLREEDDKNKINGHQSQVLNQYTFLLRPYAHTRTHVPS